MTGPSDERVTQEPCPSCGAHWGRGVLAVAKRWARYCDECGDVFGVYATEAEALAAWNTRHAATAPLLDLIEAAREVFDDVETHRVSWRQAIITARAYASEHSESPEADCSYWDHELRAFDRTFAALTAALAQHRTNGDG